MSDSTIVRAEIHPALGIMRVGSSDESYLSPEVTPLAPTPAGSTRDADRQLKRQAVRFRVYASRVATVARTYRAHRDASYATETRWPDALFWARRLLVGEAAPE